MPAIGGTDPADLDARARAELGFSRLLEQPRRVAPPPRFGGSSGYPVWYRVIQLEKFHAGEEIQVSLSSIYRWDVHPGPYRQTGNRPRTTVVGVDLLNLVTYITAWPDATLDEMAAFIYNEGGGSLLPPGNIQSPKGSRRHVEKGVDRRVSDAAAGRRVSCLEFLELSSSC